MPEMLNILPAIEREFEAHLHDPDAWNGCCPDQPDPDYRWLYRQVGEYRLSIWVPDARLLVTRGLALTLVPLRPIARPLAFRVLSGECQIALGFQPDSIRSPEALFSRAILSTGSAQEITQPGGWYEIGVSENQDAPAFLSVSGTTRYHNGPRLYPSTRPLAQEERQLLLDFFSDRRLLR